MHGKVSTTYARLLYDFLGRRGFDAEAVLGREAPPKDPTGLSYLPIDDWIEMLGRADRALGLPALGLQVGATIEPHHAGLVGYLLLSCANLGQAMRRHNEFERLNWDHNTGRVSAELRGVRIEWGTQFGRVGPLADECNLAAIVAFARNMTGLVDGAPLEVRFVNPEPPSVQPYLDFFRCPVSFNSPTTVLRVPYALLLHPLRKADAALHDLLELQAKERLSRLPSRDAFDTALQEAIAMQLSHGSATLAGSAQRMDCSARTLQRRLDERGTSFQAMLDEARQRLAQSYLADPALRIVEVSHLLGYSDQAAFTRAFTRWMGCSPAKWRARQTAKPGDG